MQERLFTMSVTILPYIDKNTTQELKKINQTGSVQTSSVPEGESFQEILAATERAQQAMAVDALIAASNSGSVSIETVQKLLGFTPQAGAQVYTTDTASAASKASNTTTDSVAEATTASSASSLSCPDSLESYFKEAAEKYDVDINLLKSIAKAESGFDPSATSSAGAMGVMQLMPATASSLGITDAYDAHDNILGGAQIISQNLKKYDGDLSLALAAYNAGSGNVDKYGGIPPFEETQNYVKKVLNYYQNSFSTTQF